MAIYKDICRTSSRSDPEGFTLRDGFSFHLPTNNPLEGSPQDINSFATIKFLSIGLA